MKVHIAFGAHNLERNLSYIRHVAQTVRNNGGSVAIEGYEAVNKRLQKNVISRAEVDWDGIIKNHMNALDKADLFIIEGSNYNFSNGFWAAHAIIKRKPTLFLYRLGEDQFTDLNAMFVSGLMSDSFSTRTYRDETELEEIVSDFLRQNKVTKKSVNLEIDENIDALLEQRARKTGRQKSEIIKEILGREMYGNEGS